MADVPASYSTTSYYGGRNDGHAPGTERGWDGRGRGDTVVDPYSGPLGPADGWGEPAATYGAGYPVATGYPAGIGRSASRAETRRTTRQRGLSGWLALAVLLAIAGVGGLIDMLSGSTVRGGFNLALVVASVVAILIVRHRDMFPIVVAPPLVYVVASGVMVYFRSDHLHNRKILIDIVANWLVYGFPAIAGASAAVLIIAGIRLVIGK